MALAGVAAGLGASTAQAGASAAASTGVIVAESGRITLHGESLRIGGSTANDVRRAEGGKPTSSMGLMGRMGPAGQLMTYRTGKGKSACIHEYGFSTKSPHLGSFESTCRDTRTATGTKFGMSGLQVMGHQFAKAEYSPPMGHDCTFHKTGVATESGSTWLVVWLRGGKSVKTPNLVSSIAIYGANAPIWDAACA
ncbi:MAG: hypothetical protein ACXVZO_07075 [Gaiellaceae bacterium]